MLVSSWFSWIHSAGLVVDKMVNCDHREIVREAHHIFRAGAGQAPEVVARCRVFPVEPLLRSNAMINPIATNGHKYLEPLLAHSGAPADSDGAKQPPLSETPYTPYSEQPALPEVPYKPYAEKPSHEAPYEPYKGI
jgi:hypothetical protein